MEYDLHIKYFMISKDVVHKFKRNSEGRIKFSLQGFFAPGFTLLEVMVSVAILGIGILMVVQLFSGGLGLAASVGDYTDTVLFAREKMAKAFLDDDLSGGLTSGVSDDGLEWSIDVNPVESASQGLLAGSGSGSGSMVFDKNSKTNLFDIAVTVYNPETRRRFALSSVRYDGDVTP